MPVYDYEEEDSSSANTRVVGDDVERAGEGVPIFGDVSGINDKMADLRRQRSQETALGYIRNPALEDPRLENMMGRPKAAGVMADQGTMRAQREALQRLQGMQRVGRGAQEAALMSQRRQAEAAQMQGAQRQGAAGAQTSGMRGGAQIGAVEGALANQGVGRVGDLTDMDRATYARALQALQGSGELSSRMRQQHADESFARYEAEDAGSRFDYDHLESSGRRARCRRLGRSREGRRGELSRGAA
jgi:hypothetical protein